MKKKIIIYTIKDPIFTLPIINKICKFLEKNYTIEILYGKKSINMIFKTLVCFFLFGSIIKFILTYLKSSQKLNITNSIKIVKEESNDYEFGISFNYSKKIKIKKFKIYNFHIGDLKKQRGVFIFFYKYLYNWKTLDLTFHEINKNFDSGKILKRKKINIKNINCFEICSIYSKNYNFILQCLKLISSKISNRKNIVTKTKGKYNSEPSLIKILNFYFK